jgi:ribosomal protein S27E
MLARELEVEANQFEAQIDQPGRQDTDPAPPPESARSALIGRVSQESKRLLTDALRGEFYCVHCAARGPHTNVTAGDAVRFHCAGCGKALGALEIKLAVFATLARIAAEGAVRERSGR